MKLDKWQQDFLATKGDKILNSGRRVGKTFICGIDAGEWGINVPQKKILAQPTKKLDVLMIAPTERQAYFIFEATFSYLNQKYPTKLVISRS